MCVILFLQLAHGTIASPGMAFSSITGPRNRHNTPCLPPAQLDKDKDSAKTAHLTTGGQRGPEEGRDWEGRIPSRFARLIHLGRYHGLSRLSW